jgi:sucrose-6-phosphate hydrolase SacC (GH32 family)
MINLGFLRNPVWRRSDNLRDPAVLPLADGYMLFYSRYSNADWSKPENWAVASVFTRDFLTYENDRDLTPKGFASPGDPVLWHGRYLLPYQSYPQQPAQLFYSASDDGKRWGDAQPFLHEANDLPWNTRKRVIDPAFVVDGKTLHCFFVGSCPTETPGRHANLLGHAQTSDPSLRDWQILTGDAPLIGRSERAYDGVENVTIFRTANVWTMIYSEGLADQHLAVARSDDLVRWHLHAPLTIPAQSWFARKHGAPFVWRDGEQWLMILMGTDSADRTTFGLLSSPDGKDWTPLDEGA